MMNSNQSKILNLFKTRLAQATEKNELQGLKEKVLLKGDDADKVNFEREENLSLKLKWREALYIKKIEKAIKRIEEGNFGICQDCDGEIQEKRLLARPTAELCLTCKEERELEESHIIYAKKSHTTGKGIASNIVYLKDNSGVKDHVLEKNMKLAETVSIDVVSPN